VTLLERTATPAQFSDVLHMHRVVMAVQAAGYHGDRLRRHPDDYPPNVRALIEEGLRHPAVVYDAALAAEEDINDQLTRMLNGVRFFLTPATTTAAPDPSTTGDPAFNSPWSFTGHPTVSLPYTYTSEGMPLAVQLVGSPMCEDDLFAAASWLQRVIGFEPRPLPL
jgi:Asp-tRNA(Asn)/Glu-tRNA(Gln) amidotransferase A subunit family amidase